MSMPHSARTAACAPSTPSALPCRLSVRLRHLRGLRGLPVVFAALLCTPSASSAPGERRPESVASEAQGGQLVTLAEVASQVEQGATRLGDLKALLRREVEAELAAIDWSKQSLRRHYKLSAAIVRLDAARAQGGLHISCTVSAAVRNDRGVLLAIVEGRARAEGDEKAGAGRAIAEQGALSGAVRGAITAVPEAIRRSK